MFFQTLSYGFISFMKHKKDMFFEEHTSCSRANKIREPWRRGLKLKHHYLPHTKLSYGFRRRRI